MSVKTGYTVNNPATAIPVSAPKVKDTRTAQLFSQGISLIAASAAIAEPARNVKKAEKIEKKLEPIARDIEKIKSFLADLKNPTISDRVLSGYWNFSLELQSEIKRCRALIPDSNQPRILLQMKNAQGENILESYLSLQTAKFEALRELAAIYRSGAQDAHKIGTLQIAKQKTFQFTLSHVLTEALLETDTVATSVEISKLHQLQDFYIFLHSPQCSNEFIYEKFQKLDFEIKTALGEAVWTACYSPNEPFFTDHFIAKNPRILLECINRDGVDVIIQLMEHYKAKVELQRFKKEFPNFAEAFKKNPKPATFQNSLPKFARKDIANLVWMEHGAKHDPNFGYWRYGEIQIERNPQVLTRKDHDGMSILEIYAKMLDGKIAYDIRQGAKQFAKEMQLPNEPIDCSVKKCTESLPENTRIAMVTAEYAGVISMGGLAPAVAGMTRAYGTKNARVILPKYDVINPKLVLKEKEKYRIEAHGTTYKVYKTNVGGVKCYLIENPLFNVGFNEEGKANSIYEGSDVETKRRFAHFSSLSAELVNKMSRKAKNPVELVHVHDAQTALVPKILASRHYSDWKEGKTPAVVFTFHNNNTPLTYDYPEVQNHLAEIGLPCGPLNAFIDGMDSSDMNTTVSKSFALEVQTALHGKGMQKYVKIHAASGKLAGIVNGNTEGWNPKTDAQLKNWVTEDGVLLDLTYGPDDKDLDNKKLLIRQQLVEYLHNRKLAEIDPKKPIFFYVGRYDAYQKGIDKLPIIMDEALKNDAQFICIGLDPDPKADGILKEMEEIAKQRGNKGVCVIRDFKRSDGRLHWQQGNVTVQDRSGVQGFGSLLRAAVDLAIFPSIFEPCGLVQGEMHNMGIETIATEIGGFKDTIFTSGPNRNGYLFERHPQWESEEQNKAIRAVVREAAFAQHAKLEALYSGNQTESERFTKRSRKIMESAAKSTWTSTFDGSPSPKEQLQHAYGKAFKNRKKRGKIHLDIHGLKKA